MYESVAQVVPVLLLALAFESRALERIRQRTRTEEQETRFWKSWRVRTLGIFMCLAAAVAEVLALLVLNDTVEDSGWVQVAVIGATLALLAILLGRIIIDVVAATPSDRSA